MMPWLLFLWWVWLPIQALPKANSGLTRLEQEELAFMKSSLKREIDDATDPAHEDTSLHGQEKKIRKAYRNIARRFKRNIFDDQVKFEFQMRILNLAKEALMKGDGLGASGWAEEDEEEEDDNETRGSGRELPGTSRASDEILKNIHSWQELALEEGVRFDDPEQGYFVGHTQHAYRDAFAGNWSKFLREELAELWPAASALQYQLELEGNTTSEARAESLRLTQTARELAHDSLLHIASILHHCGGRDPGELPEFGNTTAWVDVHLNVSQGLRALFAENASLPETCAAGADREVRAALLELNLEALERLSTGDGHGRIDVLQELRHAHGAALAANTAAAGPKVMPFIARGHRFFTMPLHCPEAANQKRSALERLWEEYHFGPLVEEAYPSEYPCGLQGLSNFLDFHLGREGELLERRAEPDRSVLKALRGLLHLQQVLARPAYMSSGSHAESGLAAWREAVTDVEEAVWKGIAFPELHTAVGQLMAELAKGGFMPEVFAAMMEHPPVLAGGNTLPQGREPSDVQAHRWPRFQGMSIPGYNMKPVQRYEERALRMWGDEEIEEHWDPVRLGLSYIDLTAACDLPLQVAMCFLSAALWFWRALELLGDNCGGDGWLDLYIFEDIWAAPPASKRIAMQYSLKRAIIELVDYAANMAEHHLLPGARLAVQRIGYLLLRKMTARFGTPEDGSKVMAQLKRFFTAARVNPLWSPPLLPVADAVFIDILSGRLHSAFLEKLHESDSKHVLPSTVPEYTLYEAALLGGSDVSVTSARHEVMFALLHDTGRTWRMVESALQGAMFRQDPWGFVLGRRSDPLPLLPEFAAVRGLRIDMSTGKSSLLLARPSSNAPALFSLDDVAAVLALQDSEPLALMLDPPAQKGVGMSEFPHHPFQRASLSPSNQSGGTGRRVEEALVQAALAVQQLASGTEVAFRAPFPLRPCAQGLCRSLPKTLRDRLQQITQLRAEAWDSPSRLVLECPRIPYWQAPAGNILDVRFGDPRLEVHAGQPLRELNEEEFRKWPVTRLRAAVERVDRELGSHREAELPALEKQELVDRLLRATERGILIEDDEETGEPMVRFSRRLTHHLAEVGRAWPQLARMVPFCALRAAGLILRMQLQQMNESANAQQEDQKQASEDHAASMQRQQEEGWRSILAEVHASVLGPVDLDPAHCFGPDVTFAQCCSVGDFEANCWDGAWSAERCCGAARDGARQATPEVVASVAAQLGSVSSRRPPPDLLIPAVDAWLKHPFGRSRSGSSGETRGSSYSMALISLLSAEVRSEETIRQQVLKKLDTDLKALNLGGEGPVSLAEGSEAWLPVVPLANSGGRRALYATVALSPQLVPLEQDEVEAAREHLHKVNPGIWNDVPLEELVQRNLPKEDQTAERPVPLSPNLRALYEATALTKMLAGTLQGVAKGASA
ncbi:Uncharacterized protein SCF082_LOCUS35655 [Durusdinium trenchii]|uniref:Uncharacterized protein n=1 Tax=Durusdinium trenchii TaxID=1381693 RepID=A0ABP0P9R5_9DINO